MSGPRLLNVPLLKQSWALAWLHLPLLAPVMILFGFINDALLSLSGTDQAQQAELLGLLQQSGGGLEGLAAIDQAIGSSQDPTQSLISIGLLLLAASIELVILMGLLELRSKSEPVRVAPFMAFLRHGLMGSFKGFWKGFFRFLVYCTVLSLGILAYTFLQGQVSTLILLAIAVATVGVFLSMMLFLQPYIFATLRCIFVPLPFADSFANTEKKLEGRRLEILGTLLICGAPGVLASVPSLVMPAAAAVPLTIILASLFSLPAIVLLYLYDREFAA